MSLYLCVDCGGSKTSAVIADANANIVGRGSGGPSNFAYLSLDAFIAAVSDAVSEALNSCLPSSAKAINLPLLTAPFAAAWLGVSGADSPVAVLAIAQALSPILNIPVGLRLQVANDTHLLAAPLRMHSDTSHAVAVIAGTGSIAVSFRKSGDEIEELGRYGGWGWILGDEGGGFSVGREIIRQLLHEHDKASVRGVPPPESELRTNILQCFGVAHVMELLTAIHFVNPTGETVGSDSTSYAQMAREKRLSSLSPLVFAAAFEDSDPLALKVLRMMAGELAEQIAYLLAPENDDSQRAVKARESLLSFGGSLAGVDEYREMILGELESRGHVFKRVEYASEAAALGAVGLAIAFGRA